MSGFDSLEECFGDVEPFIHAVETGLSADPPMLARVSSLRRYAVLSNSDTPWVRERYRAFRCDGVLARRNINSKEELRGPVGELIITSRRGASLPFRPVSSPRSARA